jgi:hypothetical protein
MTHRKVTRKTPKKMEDTTKAAVSEAPLIQVATPTASDSISEAIGEVSADAAQRGEVSEEVNEEVTVDVAAAAGKPSPTQKVEKDAVEATLDEAKPAKAKKEKLVRDSFTMPTSEYAAIGNLKKRCLNLGVAAKKSEILRAAIVTMANLSDTDLVAAIESLEVIKTGRPAKATTPK